MLSGVHHGAGHGRDAAPGEAPPPPPAGTPHPHHARVSHPEPGAEAAEPQLHGTAHPGLLARAVEAGAEVAHSAAGKVKHAAEAVTGGWAWQGQRAWNVGRQRCRRCCRRYCCTTGCSLASHTPPMAGSCPCSTLRCTRPRRRRARAAAAGRQAGGAAGQHCCDGGGAGAGCVVPARQAAAGHALRAGRSGLRAGSAHGARALPQDRAAVPPNRRLAGERGRAAAQAAAREAGDASERGGRRRAHRPPAQTVGRSRGTCVMLHMLAPCFELTRTCYSNSVCLWRPKRALLRGAVGGDSVAAAAATAGRARAGWIGRSSAPTYPVPPAVANSVPAGSELAAERPAPKVCAPGHDQESLREHAGARGDRHKIGAAAALSPPPPPPPPPPLPPTASTAAVARHTCRMSRRRPAFVQLHPLDPGMGLAPAFFEHPDTFKPQPCPCEKGPGCGLAAGLPPTSPAPAVPCILPQRCDCVFVMFCP